MVCYHSCDTAGRHMGRDMKSNGEGTPLCLAWVVCNAPWICIKLQQNLTKAHSTFMKRHGVSKCHLAALAMWTTMQEAKVLGRALKEHTRRIGTKEGFEATPQDCMAFKFYRDVGAPPIAASASM